MEITIITACYNCESTIGETIKSVLAQSHKKWRLIAFDDGSSDGSARIVREYASADERIRLFSHPGRKNLGLRETLKKALELVKTDYIAFLECDDIWHKDYLKEKILFLKANPKAEIIFNDVECFGVESRRKKLSLFNGAAKLYLKILNPFSKAYDLNFPLMAFNPIPTFSCVMMKTALAETYGFNSPYPPMTDYFLWAELSFKHKFYFINKKLTRWRLSEKSYTMRSLNDKKGERELKTAVKSLYRRNDNPISHIPKVLLSSLLLAGFKMISAAAKPMAKKVFKIRE